MPGFRSRVRTARACASLLFATLPLLSCSSDGGGPTTPTLTTGTVAVAVATGGPDGPADYTVALDGGTARSIAANGSTAFTGVVGGSHAVTLGAVPDNCTVSGTNPRPATLTAGQTANVSFSVSCVALTGSLIVSTETTGDDVDPDGYAVEIDGGTGLAIGTDETLTAQVLPIGDHEVALTGLAANCAVTGDNPRTVAVATDQTVSTTFTVACDPTTGAIEVTSTTTGADLDADGYTVDLDGTTNQGVDANGTVTFTGVPEGAHTLTLSGVAVNCTVTGDNPAASTVVIGQTDAVAFDLTCTPVTGTLRVTANTTGSPLDADGYDVSVDGGSAQLLDVNGDTIAFAAQPEGDRSVLLGEIGPGCTVTGANPVTATVPAAGEVLAVFDLTCTSDLGAIELTTVTTGLDVDSDGYMVSLDSGPAQPIGNDDVMTFTDLAAGSHSLQLDDVAGNCTVQGANPEMPIVTANDTIDVTMTVDCADIPNVMPTVTISSPDTTRTVAPLTVAPGDPVTFTGAGDDPEDGTLTGGSLVWTSNLDGQIGTGETFMTSSLSEGQHTVTLTATDGEAGTATTTVLVVVVGAPEPGFQIKLRLSEGVTLTPGQWTAIEGAIAKLESIVTGDVGDVPIAFGAFNCAADVPPTNETVDDLLLYLSVEPIDGPNGILGAAGPCVFRGNRLPALGGMRFDSADLAALEASGYVDELLLHEAMHVMGFGTIWDDLGFLEDPTSPGNGGTSGNDTYFDGPMAVTQFGVLDPAGDYTGGNIVPVENDDDAYGPGSLDGHWRESVFDNELMTPSLNGGGTVNPLSILTIGQFEDLGYTVDTAAADPYGPVFTLRAGLHAGRGPMIHMRDDIFRGPSWIVAPSGAAFRVR